MNNIVDFQEQQQTQLKRKSEKEYSDFLTLVDEFSEILDEEDSAVLFRRNNALPFEITFQLNYFHSKRKHIGSFRTEESDQWWIAEQILSFGSVEILIDDKLKKHMEHIERFGHIHIKEKEYKYSDINLQKSPETIQTLSVSKQEISIREQISAEILPIAGRLDVQHDLAIIKKWRAENNIPKERQLYPYHPCLYTDQLQSLYEAKNPVLSDQSKEKETWEKLKKLLDEYPKN